MLRVQGDLRDNTHDRLQDQTTLIRELRKFLDKMALKLDANNEMLKELTEKNQKLRKKLKKYRRTG